QQALAETYASHLCTALRTELPQEKPVALAPDCPPATALTETAPVLAVELGFFEESVDIHCVATVRHFRSRRVLALSRVTLPGADPAATIESTATLAKALLAESWRSLAAEAEGSIPVPLQIQLAAAPHTRPGHGSAADDDGELRRLVSRHE